MVGMSHQAVEISGYISEAAKDWTGMRDFEYLKDNERFFEEHATILWTAGLAYCPVVYLLGVLMSYREKGFGLKGPLAIWNAILGIFSILAALALVPAWVEHMHDHDFVIHDSLCSTSIFTKPAGFVLFLFNLSKGPEFIDTIFLRLRKKSVIFLHWYHHIATFLYCWLVGSVSHHYNGVGFLFGTMNVVVHSFMYTYYFLQAVDMGKPLQACGINTLLTTLQLAQMAVGTYTTLHVQWKCPREHRYPEIHYYATLVMYASYLFLFGKLFIDKYIAPPKQNKKPKEE
eukprot:gb/GECG01009094.1/.p1 GENE.gb/GECG01009094.1/~~gb/GECG01009094.1/.p1  ORF type:complete len:287 (+),score=15.72 gb/GECG01009094.1/:1-861(+)